MSLATSNRMDQQAMDEAVCCAKYFARKVLDTIDDMETLGRIPKVHLLSYLKIGAAT